MSNHRIDKFTANTLANMFKMLGLAFQSISGKVHQESHGADIGNDSLAECQGKRKNPYRSSQIDQDVGKARSQCKK